MPYMTAAFDTIKLAELLEILKTFIHDDEVRMIQLLLSNTTLDIKMNGVETKKFESNIGSPQGDGVSGVLFNIYLENTLRELRGKLDPHDIYVEHSYAEVPESIQKSMLPEEMIYADDSDFATVQESKKDAVIREAPGTFEAENLLVNEEKIEETEIERGDRNTEMWRHVKKLGSLLGDSEDIARRKQLAIAGMNDLSKIWLRRDHIHESVRLELYNALVKPILTYNCGTWGLTQKDEESLNSFHRQQLRYLIGKRWPHHISNANLYKRCDTFPLSLFILRARWRLFGHILRGDPRMPANRAMLFYFEPTEAAGFRGRPRITIVTTLDSDIRRTRAETETFPFSELKSMNDLYLIRKVAMDRKKWKDIVEDIYRVAEAIKSL